MGGLLGCARGWDVPVGIMLLGCVWGPSVSLPVKWGQGFSAS